MFAGARKSAVRLDIYGGSRCGGSGIHKINLLLMVVTVQTSKTLQGMCRNEVEQLFGAKREWGGLGGGTQLFLLIPSKLRKKLPKTVWTPSISNVVPGMTRRRVREESSAPKPLEDH